MNKPTDLLDLPIPFTTPITRHNVREIVASCERAHAVSGTFLQLLEERCACGHELGDHGAQEPHACGCERVGEACPCLGWTPETAEQRAASAERPRLELVQGGK